ncbi:MAG: hypothetical protein A2600_13050 [Candidatus Lambdaproteobacteria bacterium RIFOXYD1_FULL_56_27]|uniref:Uncharacterized protein n=1 Tax=Candidatus Lambdaproteobacteria bacterium RIFOXYD2_FULL_56_26 TaxID=1817773 RepID=A0A1F6GZM1_9PROT|nr:MAG: hypothetical protein A2426_06095 [Candidatus Lambdaproteobacteria bacterium RIFOXYC1_FULL_56_13]OGH03616.1 MAG: hypothetical protein A2557_13865 [Candidatus Lambdaproteobacteria bacterium RIFOXYD2_FULL_56_26]OGH06547.1 MAG: hypothetical protein A2600_13050 [Candidatus Lambdaproteobacteria bacterium RIFOXYD1_FULL_56_27]
MDAIEIKRTIRQILNYSTFTDVEHHLVVAGLGVFHINETKKDADLAVDVWLQTDQGKRIWLTFDNLEMALGDLIH